MDANDLPLEAELLDLLRRAAEQPPEAACPTAVSRAASRRIDARFTRWMGRSNWWKRSLIAVAVDVMRLPPSACILPHRSAASVAFPQRRALGLDTRESTPGFQRQMIVLNGETRSLKRASIVMKRVVGLAVSANTIERICLEGTEAILQIRAASLCDDDRLLTNRPGQTHLRRSKLTQQATGIRQSLTCTQAGALSHNPR